MVLKWVECDLDILGDGTIVLSHDDTHDRCTDQVGRLSELTKNDLDTIDAGAWFSEQFRGERLPTNSIPLSRASINTSSTSI